MYSHQKRRGRPRRNRPIIDLGTMELQQKRNAMVQGNPDLAESLLGVLYGRQHISKPLYEAGRFFGELGYRFEPCLGHKFRQQSSILIPKIENGKGSNPFHWDEEQDEKRTHAWRRALLALKKAGDSPYKVVLNVVFYEQDFYTIPFLKSVIPFVQPLQIGLELLDAYFKGGSQAGRDKQHDRGLNLDRATRFQPPLKECRFYSPP